MYPETNGLAPENVFQPFHFPGANLLLVITVEKKPMLFRVGPGINMKQIKVMGVRVIKFL